jgi:hypothetical protein
VGAGLLLDTFPKAFSLLLRLALTTSLANRSQYTLYDWLD